MSKENNKNRNVVQTVAKLFIGSAMINMAVMPLVASQARADVVGSLVDSALRTMSLPSYRYDDYDFEKYQDAYRDAERHRERAYSILLDVDRQLAETQQAEKQAGLAVLAEAKVKEQTTNKINKATAQLAAKQSELIAAQNSLPNLNKQVKESEGLVASTQAVVTDLETRHAAAATPEEKATLQTQIDAQKKVLAQLTQQLEKRQAELAKTRKAVADLTTEIKTIETAIAADKAELVKSEAKLKELVQRHEGLRATVAERTRMREQARRDLEQQDRALAFARGNLDKVRNNIDQARETLTRDGEVQGSQDGQREGYELGNSRGSQEGSSKGIADGRREGETAGRQRDYSQGVSVGRNKATQDAQAKASVDAEVAGRNAGQVDGKKAGLNAAYALGNKEGLAHGEKTGDDKSAYAEGRAEGEASGKAQAVENAKPMFGRGYTDKENEYLNAALKPVTVGDAAQAQKFKGLQGRYSGEGDDRYYRPQPGILPHPRLERFYLEAYDRTYRESLSRAYSAAYNSSYTSAFDYNYRVNYDETYTRIYQDSYENGYSNAYGETYRPAYDRQYRATYDVVYKQTYNQTFEAFKLDTAERARGFADGNRTASRAKGVREGFKDAYDNNIKLEEKKAYDAGVAKANDLYRNNAVVKVTAIDVRDADGDGIYRPGEGLVAVMKLKNFGLQAKTDLQSAMSEGSGAIVVKSEKVVAAAIPAQSDATVLFPIQAQVSGVAIDGNVMDFTVRATSGTGLHLAQRISLVAKYPVEIQVLKFDGVLLPNEETQIKVQAYNRSNAVQNLKLTATADTMKVKLAQNEFTLSALAAGETRQFVITATGLPEARFEESPLTILTQQSGMKFAMDKVQSMTVIRRHSPTADSKGLIISGNLGLGAGKAIYALDKFDTWDLRADGSLEMADLAAYKNKILHVLADTNGKMDATSMLTLGQYVREGGSVITWGPELNKTEVGVDMLRILGVAVSNTHVLNGALTGVEKLKGVSFNSRGIVSSLVANSLRAAPALMSAHGPVAMTSFQKGTDEAIAQSMMVGMDLRDVDATQFKNIVATFQKSRQPFTTKLANAVKSPAAEMHLVAADIANEIIEADSNIDFYKNNVSKSKLMRSINKFLGENGPKASSTKEWAKYYPYLVGVIKAKKSPDQHRVRALLDTELGGVFSKTSMKEVFCDNNKHSICN